MKIFNIFFCIVFIIFAALQYNDPDPYVWIPIYLYAAILCARASSKKYYPAAYGLGILIYASYAVYKFFCKDGVLDWIRLHNEENIAETMKATKPWIEETREFFGLLILIVVLLINLLYARSRVKRKEATI
ncbi:MAG: transmembrane 220 family protein [Chitinophagales bacterium]